MARKQRLSPPTISDPLQNDVVEEDAASSESDNSSPKPSRERPSVKRALTLDPTHKSGSTPDPKATRKRASDNLDKGVSKKARDEKNPGVKRLWSEEDELVIMQGLIDYQLEYDEDPRSDYEAFFEFLKDSLHVKVSVAQLKGKIKKLKSKYKAQKGDDVVFAKPNEEKLFQLSKKVWGGGNSDEVNVGRKNKDTGIGKAVVNDGVNGNGVEVDVDEDQEESEGLDFKGMYPFLSEMWESDVNFPQQLKDISARNLKLNASEKMRGLEDEWKDVFVKDLQLYLKKLDLKTKLAKVVLDQMLSSDP